MLLSLPVIRLQVFLLELGTKFSKLKFTSKYQTIYFSTFAEIYFKLNSLNLYYVDSLEEMLIYGFGYVFA